MEAIIKTVGIKVLKDHLSAYIQQVKRGSRILITDRDRVVAELREPMKGDVAASVPSRLVEWAQEGKVRLPLQAKPHPYLPTSLQFPTGTATRWLDEDRGQ